MPEGYVPGSGAALAGAAVDYAPDDNQTNKMVAYFHQQNIAQQEREQQRTQAAQVHKDALQKYYGNQFDIDKFDTKTALNEPIDNYLSKGHQAVSEAIQQGVDGGDLEKIVQQSLQPAVSLYQRGSLIQANAKNTADALKTDKGIDTDSLYKQSLLNALYNRDDKGGYKLKSPEEIQQVDPQHDYSKDILDNNPELISKAGVDLEGNLGKFKPSTVKSSGAFYSSPGVKQKGSHEATWLSGVQNFGPDAKGVNQITTADEPIQTKDANGNPVTIHQVPDAVLSQFQQTVGGKAALDVATKQYAAQHGLPDAKPGTQVFEQMKKAMLYDKIDKIAPKKISESHDISMSAPVIKMQLGIPMGGKGAGGSGDGSEGLNPASFQAISSQDFKTNDGSPGGKIDKGQVSFGINPTRPGVTQGSIPVDDMDEGLRNVIAKSLKGNDVDIIKDAKTGETRIPLKVENGQVTAVRSKLGTWITLPDVKNANISQANATKSKKNQIPYDQTNTTTKKQKISW